MPSLNLLAISNPSDYSRGGYITVPWQPIYQQFQIPAEELVLSDLRDRSHLPLLAQIDRVDPDDPSRDTLVFSLNQPIPAGSEDNVMFSAFVRVDRGKSIPQGLGEPYIEVVYGTDGLERGVRFVNNRLIVWFNLVSAPEGDQRNWYAGSATSVQLDHQEILDPFHAAKGEWLGQDPEKRCLQVAELQLPGLPHPKSPYYQVCLFNHPYRLVSQSSGPVRASITIATEPFDYIGSDPITGENCHLICELYRVISLYAGADYLVEELFVKGKPKLDQGESTEHTEAIALHFAPRYFAHMHMGEQPEISQPPHVPSWFAVASSAAPNPGYGFVTDLHIDAVTYPHEGDQSRFSWQLLPCTSAKCLHLFMRDQAGGVKARTGHCWYELIYKPLKAEIYQETPVSQGVINESFVSV